MNKSKFLKRSLAAILAILMVVAMVPMGALAADETFDVSVNSRQADTADGDTYAVTIYNTRLASIDWAPKPDWTAEIKTKRDITLSLPVSSLDLMSEATKVAGTENVYSLDMTFKNTKENKTIPAKLNVTVETSVPNDDVTLQAVRVNQTINGTTFSAIKGEKPVNGKITIKIPLGMKYDQVGFTTSNLADIAAQVFVPSSPYARVSYTQPGAYGAPDANNAQGKVTVTAPTGRTATYDVVFEQEEGLKGMSVNFGADHTGTANFSERTFENNQTYSVYTAYVPLTGADAVTTNNAHIIFSHDANVQRVEDPAATDGDLQAWSTTLAQAYDEPIQSGEKGENTLVFKAAGDGSYYTYLSVKTKANNDDSVSPTPAYYGNVKLVLRDKADEEDAKVAPILTELQFNGYESKYNATGLEKTITYNVDASYYEQVGNGKLPARISLTTDSAANVWILNQDGSRVKVATGTGSVGANRIGKPNTLSSVVTNGKSYVGSFNAKARQFTIRVEDPNDVNNFNDYVVNLVNSNHGTNMNKVKLVNGTTVIEAVKSTGNQFIFYIDPTTYPNVDTPIAASKKSDAVSATSPENTAEFDVAYANDGNTESLNLKYTFSEEFFTNSALEAKLEEIANEPVDPIKYEFQLVPGEDVDATKLLLQAKDSEDADAEWETVAIGEQKVEKDDQGDTNPLNDTYTLVVEFKIDTDTIGKMSFTFESASGINIGKGSNAPFDTDVTVADAATFKTWLSRVFDDNQYLTKKPVLADERMTDMFPTTGTPVKVTSTGDKVIYTSTSWVPATTKSTLDSTLKGFDLIIESDKGVVLTPGGDMTKTLKGNAKTSAVGVSEWGKDNTPYATNGTMKYQEHENSITTLGDCWVPGYLLKLSDNNTVGTPVGAAESDSDAVLVMTTSNLGASNNNRTQTWTIRFEDKSEDPATPSLSEDAELTFQGATTAVDEDLIYDGRTRKQADVVKLDRDGSYTSTDDDAPYIGAIGARGDDHNNFNIEVSEAPADGSGEKNAYVVKIHMPEDYFVDNQIVYLYGLTASPESSVYRGDETNFDSTTITPARQPDTDNWYKLNLIEKFSLDMDDQTQTGANDDSNKQFMVQTNVWNGSNFNKNAVSDKNILYVYSQKDSKADGTALTTPTRKYYITFVKDNFDKTETMSGVKPVDSSTGITGDPNAYEKWLNLSVPFGKNWVNYRDDSTRDFTLDFIKGGKAILVDAAQDEVYKPFGSAESTTAASTSYLSLQNQKLREVKIDTNTTFFVKENELWIYDQYTGKETKVTGRGLNTNFTYSGWGVITSGNAELHVFNEDQSSINTYRLTMNVNDISSAKEITSIRVDETAATRSPDGKTWTVDLGPAGSENLSKVMLNISVSPTATKVTVNGEDFDSTKTYDLTKPATIVVTAEDGTTATYTLSATGDDPNPPVEDKESDKYTDIPSGAMGDWVKDAINYGIMSSNVSGKYEFQPKDTTPRRYFALMVARADIMANNGAITTKEAADEKLLADYGDKEPDFKDTAKEDPKIKAAIVYCQEKKIMNGDEKGNFNPGDIVDRMQVASMLANWLKLTPGDKTENTHGFKDWDKIASWAKGNINAVATDKIMEGNDDGTFGTGKLTREQTAVVMVKVYKRLKGITD